MQTHRLAMFFTLAGCLLPAYAAAETEPDLERSASPYFLIEGAERALEAFPLESTDVVANVNGVIADVVVRQVYRNGGAVPIHARYVFPASTRAAVHGMQFELGGKRVVAKIEEKQRASEQFEQARSQGKTASLLEQARPNVFSMALANIMPGDKVSVELRYSELLVPESGVYQFVYPTVVGPRYDGGEAQHAEQPRRRAEPGVSAPYLDASEAPPAPFHLAANLSAGMPIADVHCDSHAVNVAMDGPELARVSLLDAKNAGDRDFILQYRLAGAGVQSGLMLYEGAQENFFLMMVQPPARVVQAEIPPREYVFVLDVSGSMLGFPLDTAKVLMRNLLGQLRPSDSFNVLFFSGESKLMAPQSLPATKQNIAAALVMLQRIEGGGGTELAAALARAVALPRTAHVSRSLLLMSDGYIARERSAFELIAGRLVDTNFFAFGIGESVDRYLIEGLARAGQGEPFVVTDPAQAHAAAERFARYVASPVLTDVRVHFDGFDAYDVEPAAQPDLFAERPVVVFGKWRGPKVGSITVGARGASQAFSQRLQVATAASRPEHEALPQLWARTRISRLSDFHFGEDDEASVKAVTELGLSYSLLTAHTSFIAVLEQVRNPGASAVGVEQPLPMPLGVDMDQEAAVDGGQYASGAEPELVWLLALLLAGEAYRVLRRRGRVAAARGEA